MKRYILVTFVAILALVVAAPAAASNGRAATAHIAKKCKKKKHGKKKKCKKTIPAPTPAPAPPAPLALTASEVVSRVTEQANAYCQVDAACSDYGYYWDSGPGDPYCYSKSTYSWTCYGYNEEYWPGDDPDTDYWWCDFREVVERDGYNGIRSHQDLTFGGGSWAPGWDCYPEEPI